MWPIYFPSKMPLSLLLGAPFATPGDARKTGQVAKKFLTEDALQQEFSKNNLVVLAPMGQLSYQILSKKPDDTVDGFKGLKIRAGGPPWPTILGKIGAANVSLSGPETYEALQRGTVDATLGAYDAWYNLHWYEVAPYSVEWSVGAPVLGFLAINKDVWNKLPPDIQKTIREVSDEAPSRLADQFDKELAPQMQKMQEGGAKIVKISPAEKARLQRLALPAIREWAQDVEKERGVPVTQYLDKLFQLTAASDAGK